MDKGMVEFDAMSGKQIIRRDASGKPLTAGIGGDRTGSIKSKKGAKLNDGQAAVGPGGANGSVAGGVAAGPGGANGSGPGGAGGAGSGFGGAGGISGSGTVGGAGEGAAAGAGASFKGDSSGVRRHGTAGNPATGSGAVLSEDERSFESEADAEAVAAAGRVGCR